MNMKNFLKWALLQSLFLVALLSTLALVMGYMNRSRLEGTWIGEFQPFIGRGTLIFNSDKTGLISYNSGDENSLIRNVQTKWIEDGKYLILEPLSITMPNGTRAMELLPNPEGDPTERLTFECTMGDDRNVLILKLQGNNLITWVLYRLGNR